MKKSLLNAYIAAARPDDFAPRESGFTDAVMARIRQPYRLTAAVHDTAGYTKSSLFAKLRHLPKIAIVAITVGILALFVGSTYAIVQTVRQLTGITITQSGLNEFGREQLNVSFDSCDAQKKNGTTYELKRDSGLSTEDGARVLQARCDLDVAETWLHQDGATKEQLGDRAQYMSIYMGMGLTTIKEVTPDGQLYVNKNNVLPNEGEGASVIPADARFVEGGREVKRDVVKTGDTVLVVNTGMYAERSNKTQHLIIFKLPLETRYYDLTFQSYVKVRTACNGNPERTCLKPSNINHVTLILTYGGGMPSQDDPRELRELQGRVVSYGPTELTLDVGNGVIYTIATPTSFIDKYNQTTVYRLGSVDTIYAKTNPEDLKVNVGDNLEVSYLEAAGRHDKKITWNEVTSIGLMVERTVKDMTVLQKY